MKIFKKSLLIIFFLAAITLAKVSMPMPTTYVEDKANIIDSSTERKLNGLMQELEQKTGAQYIVLTVKSLNGVPIDMFSIELAEQWKLGSAREDNGMLFVLSLNDREARIEVGYGLEGVITDSSAGRIIRDYVIPYAKKGDYGTGIYLANAVAAEKIAGSKGVKLTGMPKFNRRQSSRKGRPGSFLLGLLPLILVFMFGGRRGLLWYFLLGGLGGGRYGGRSSYRSSSFGGGGFGSFGGGGGGGFGGGGASGSW